MYKQLTEELELNNVQLVAVSKTQPLSNIKALYNQGQRLFGENRVQELKEKQALLPSDIQWHMIGQLQKNKVKHLFPYIALIHSVDSVSLAQVINQQAVKHDMIVKILLQVKIATEESKSGFSIDDLESALPELIELDSIRICGIMGMGTFTSDNDVTRHEFADLKKCYNLLKDKYFSDKEYFSELSMGMSGDYKIAIDAGSTMVRIGSLLFS